MILVDTSVWIQHFREGVAGLVIALEEGQVFMHPWVRGELALGNLPDRASTLTWMDALRRPVVATDADVARLTESAGLHGRGIGLVDAALLASALISTDTQLWTLDRRLAQASEELGVAREGDS